VKQIGIGGILGKGPVLLLLLLLLEYKRVSVTVEVAITELRIHTKVEEMNYREASNFSSIMIRWFTVVIGPWTRHS
jgi:hypothetical protein